MTTPRKDAIAALAEAIMAAESDDDVPWNERPRPGQVLDNLESLGWRLAALAAAPETPERSLIEQQVRRDLPRTVAAIEAEARRAVYLGIYLEQAEADFIAATRRLSRLRLEVGMRPLGLEDLASEHLAARLDDRREQGRDGHGEGDGDADPGSHG